MVQDCHIPTARPQTPARPEALVRCHPWWPHECFLAQSSEAGVGVVDRNERFTYVNPAFAAMLGYSVRELSDMGLDDVADAEEFRRFGQHTERRRRGVADTYECTLIHSSGRPVRAMVSASPMRSVECGFEGTLAVVLDVTERDRAERDLRRLIAEERLVRTISTRCINLPADQVDPAIDRALDSLTEHLACDRCALTLLAPEGEAYHLEFEACRTGVDPVGPALREVRVGSMPWARQQLDQQGFVVFGDPARPDPDEAARTFNQAGVESLVSVPLTIGGSFLGLLSAQMASERRSWTREDVDLLRRVGEILAQTLERRRVDEAMIEARAAAEAGADSRAQFLANMSHEIRTPMNAVIGVADLLASSDLSADQRDLVETIRSSGGALLRIVNDILDFARIEKGTLEIVSGEIRIRDLVESVVALHRPAAEDKELGVHVVVDDAVPAIAAGDRIRIQQALGNLVDNAVKFTDRGRVDVEAGWLEAEDGRSYLRFAVHDTGVGIDPTGREALFNPFVQVDASHTRRCGGTGLGLAICRRLVELMGGRIGVESEPDQGSTFWFTVASRAISDPSPGEAGQQPVKAAVTADVAAGRLLVVEDNVVNQKVMLRMLERLGVDADVVGTGREAVDAVLSGDYALVFMDCQMPEMDGFEATRHIRRAEAGGGRCPIVALTANAMQGDRERCLEAGMDDYLAKPVQLEEVRAAIERWTRTGDAGEATEREWASGAGEDAARVLDLNHLRSLSGGNARFERHLLGVFLDEAGEKIAALNEGLQDGDVEAVERTAHSLKGSAASIGAGRLAALAETFQEASRSDRLDAAAGDRGALELELRLVRECVEQAFPADAAGPD